MKYEIDSENILKAHKEGCSDVKTVLENIAPDLFTKKYPMLMKSNFDGTVILAIGPGKFSGLMNGYVIISRDNAFPLGHFSNDWVDVCFQPIKGVTEISKCQHLFRS